MTEAEWLTTTDSTLMLEMLRNRATKRKMRLFACGWVHLLWADLIDDRSRRGVEVSERYADGSATRIELMKAWWTSYFANRSVWKDKKYSGVVDYHKHPHSKAAFTAQFACGMPCEVIDTYLNPERGRMAEGVEARILRDIFCNPFHLVTLNPSWLTSNVLALADGIYSERAYDRMPILADAIKNAGCDNEDILNHCRQPGEHTRGCWVLDLVLDKQ
jgi:hypothetical protein